MSTPIADVGYDDASTTANHTSVECYDDVHDMHGREQSPLLDKRDSAECTPTRRDSADSISSEEQSLSSMMATVRKLFGQRAFVCWFIFKVLFFAQVFAVGLFIPLYAAEWFGGCLLADNITPIDDCYPDYTTYAYWSTMFFSIAGFITFVVSSSVGYLTDRYGRKIFFIFAIITWAIPRVTMIFYINFYLYFGLSLLTALNGGDFFIASKGYLADIIEDKEERIVGFGFGQSAVGLGCILGSILAVTISMPFDDHAVFIALGGWYILLFLFVLLFVKEPERFTTGEVPVSAENAHGINPFKYLGKVCTYNLIFYLSLLSLLMAWAESGIMTSLFAYIGNEFDLDRQGDSALVYAIFAFLMATAVVLAGFFLLPLKRLYDELWIMIIAVCIKILAFSLLALISMYPTIFNNYGVLYLSSILYGTSFLIWPTITGLLTKHMGEEEQGTGFGILDAWTSIASIVAPFSFGQLYVYSMGHGMQWLLFGVAILFCVVSIIIIAYPLKLAVKKQRRKLELLRSFRAVPGSDASDSHSRYGTTTVVAPLVSEYSINSHGRFTAAEFTPTPIIPTQLGGGTMRLDLNKISGGSTCSKSSKSSRRKAI